MVVAKSAGSFLGGIFNNPGIVILGALAVVLLFFQGDIRKAFASLGESFGKIELPDITLPEINFPEITFPSFGDITFPSIGDIFGEPVGGETFGPTRPPPEPIDIPAETLPSEGLGDVQIPPSTLLPSGQVVSETPPTFDASQFVTEEELAARLEPKQTIEELFPDQPVSIIDFINRFNLTPAQEFAIEERGATEESLGIVPFAVVTRAEDKIVEPVPIPEGTTLAEFPTAIVPETQEQFQARAESFVEAFPQITFATSLPGSELVFGEQLSRESEDFQSALEAEALRSEQIFANLFGNVQNPDFPTFTDPITGEII